MTKIVAPLAIRQDVRQPLAFRSQRPLIFAVARLGGVNKTGACHGDESVVVCA